MKTAKASKKTATAYSYLRFSSPQQAEGDSIRRQTELRDAWLKRNGVALDQSLTLRDEGVSAFKGGNRENADRHALAIFLKLVEQGRIPRGSFLIVESLDRLSREHIRPALTLLLNLIESGIRVVQLLPVETVYDEGIEPMQLMMGIMELSRGNSESRMKSERLGRAWQEKKKLAAKNGTVLTKRAPFWLRVVNGKFQIDESKARTVRHVYELAVGGYGIGVITKKLNAGGAAVIGKVEHWARSTVAKMLSDRSTIGEYQPYTGRAAKRKPDGEPVADYYPAIISEEKFHAARGAMLARKITGGRPAKARVNIFTGILADARDGDSIQMVDKGKESGPQLIGNRAKNGAKGTTYCAFPLRVFEDAILSKLRELDPAELMPEGNQAAERVQATTGKLADLSARIDTLKEKMVEGDGEIGPLVDALRKMEERRDAVKEELAAARREAGSPLSAAWDDTRSLLDVVKKAKDQDDVRTRLRAALRRIVSEDGMRCLFIAKGATRVAAVQIHFAGGECRDYLIIHRKGQGGNVPKRAAQTRVESFPSSRGKVFDLRDKSDVKELEKALLAFGAAAVG